MAENETPRVGQSMTIMPEQLEAILREVRREDPETEAEKARIKKQQRMSRELMHKTMAQAEAQKAAFQEACNHKKTNIYGQDVGTAIHGQVHSDHMFHPICLHCQKEFDPVPADRVPSAGGRVSGANFATVS